MAAVAAWCFSAAADSIVINGIQYRDVYILEGVTMYYVQVPQDGTTKHVPKSEVDAQDVVISTDEAQRHKLLRRWQTFQGVNAKDFKAKAEAKRAALKQAREAEERLMGDDDGPLKNPNVEINGMKVVKRGGVPQLTNVPDKLANRNRNRSYFIDSNGVKIATNIPEEFRGNAQFVEVSLHFETVEVPRELQFAKGTGQYAQSNVADIVSYYARAHGLDTNLVYAVIRAESNFDASAVSSAGASGLMQLMPGTAAEMGITDLFDPAQNIAGGTQYLAKMLNLFDGDLKLALAGYNAGPGNVKKYGGIPPFRETQAYVKRVQRFRDEFRRSGISNTYLAKVERVDGRFKPRRRANREHFEIVFHNGWTQPADMVKETGEYYLARIEGRDTRVPKEHVRAVLPPA